MAQLTNLSMQVNNMVREWMLVLIECVRRRLRRKLLEGCCEYMVKIIIIDVYIYTNSTRDRSWLYRIIDTVIIVLFIYWICEQIRQDYIHEIVDLTTGTKRLYRPQLCSLLIFVTTLVIFLSSAELQLEGTRASAKENSISRYMVFALLKLLVAVLWWPDVD